VNDIVAEGFCVADTERPGASRFNAAVAIRQAAPEHVVLAAGVDSDDRPHIVIVRHDRHHRRPDHVQDGEIGCVVQLLNSGAIGLADAFQDAGGIGNRAGHHLTHRFV
jgi:hypothetical protein